MKLFNSRFFNCDDTNSSALPQPTPHWPYPIQDPPRCGSSNREAISAPNFFLESRRLKRFCGTTIVTFPIITVLPFAPRSENTQSRNTLHQKSGLYFHNPRPKAHQPPKMDSSPTQVKVIFTTDEQDLQLPETKRQLLVPAGSLPIFPLKIPT